MRRLLSMIAMTTLLAAGLVLPDRSAEAAPVNVSLQPFATGLNQPIDIANSRISGDGRLFVAQREGVIRVVQSNGSLVAGNFLDISGLVNTAGEGGLLGLTFHPNYASNGFFYLYYVNSGGSIVIARYTVSGSPASSTTADAGSALIIITIPHPGQTNHYGGDLAFGPDGFLYFATGDGGGGNDPSNNAQNKESLLGKLLRLDVNTPCCGLNYSNPVSNPFIGAVAGQDEIFDYGLRNPFRFNFDRGTGDIYLGDVGQSAREEVDRHPAGTGGGLNFGWRCFEGSIPNPTPSVRCPLSNHTGPLAEYLQGSPKAITGGTVYRGSAQPSLTGHYLFADFYSGDFYTYHAGQQIKQTTFSGRNLVSFGEDIGGEVFAADIGNGTIYRVLGEPYSSQWVGQSAFPAIGAGEEATVHIDFRNTGSQDWTVGGANPVRLATTAPNNRPSGAFNGDWLSPNRPTTITGQVNGGSLDSGDTTIEPNQIGRFQFTVVGQPTTGGAITRERFRLVAEGLTFMQDQGVYLDINNLARTFSSNWAGQSNPPAVLNPGQAVNNLRFDITNTGTATWRRDTLFPTRLGTDRPADRTSPFASGWLSGNRLPNFAGKLEPGGSVTNQDTIGPGETARFQYNITAPGAAGLYREFVRPVIDGFGRLNDQGIHWETFVKNPSAPQYDYAFVGQSPYPTIARNNSAVLKLQLRNTGVATWDSDGATPLRLATDRPRDRGSGFAGGGSADGWLSVNRVHLKRNLTDPAKDSGGETTVAQGEVGEFEFTVVAAPPPGPYPEHFTPVADGVTFLRDIGIFWRITVQ